MTSRTLALCLAAGLLAGCSSLSVDAPIKLIELTKTLSTAAVQRSPTSAKDIIHHGDGIAQRVCILLNPHLQLPDLLPALQKKLREHQVSSRVFDVQTPRSDCDAWLKYAGVAQWGTPLFSDTLQPYLDSLHISLEKPDGRFMSRASFEMHPYMSAAKWASTERKIEPVIKSLLTGFSS